MPCAKSITPENFTEFETAGLGWAGLQDSKKFSINELQSMFKIFSAASGAQYFIAQTGSRYLIAGS